MSAYLLAWFFGSFLAALVAVGCERWFGNAATFAFHWCFNSTIAASCALIVWSIYEAAAALGMGG